MSADKLHAIGDLPLQGFPRPGFDVLMAEQRFPLRPAPTASDLRLVLSVMRIAAALERSGDYAKNLAKRSLVLNKMHSVEGATGSIRRMARQVGLLLKDALDSFIPLPERRFMPD